MCSESFREQCSADELADASEFLSTVLDKLGTGVDGAEVRASLSDIWITCAKQTSRERLEIS